MSPCLAELLRLIFLLSWFYYPRVTYCTVLQGGDHCTVLYCRVVIAVHEWLLTSEIIRWRQNLSYRQQFGWKIFSFHIFSCTEAELKSKNIFSLGSSSNVRCARCGKWLVRPTWNLCLTSANHLTLAINASVNFLIYCSIGTKFKGQEISYMQPSLLTVLTLLTIYGLTSNTNVLIIDPIFSANNCIVRVVVYFPIHIACLDI